MQYQVFVKNPADSEFMASVVGLPNVTANGITEKEAIDKLKVILDAQFRNGKLVTIDIDIPSKVAEEKSDPWINNMGIFQEDPTFDDFLAEVNSYRNEVDSILQGRGSANEDDQ
jgi:predicted RNase H-like HicB family nuclease